MDMLKYIFSWLKVESTLRYRDGITGAKFTILNLRLNIGSHGLKFILELDFLYLK